MVGGCGGGDKIITHGGGSSSNDNNNNKKLYKGVRLRKWGKWVSEIRLPNSRERIWLGSHDSAEKAARAFDAALYCLRGHNATFNFPDTPFKLMMELEQPHITNITHHHQSHQLLTTQEIQEIAAKFANHYSSSSSPSQQEPSSNNKTGEEDHQEKSSNEHDQVQVDNGGDGDTMMMNSIDWTFLNVLGSDHVDNQQTRLNVAAGASSSSDNNNYFGLYSSDLEKMHSGEFLYTTTPPPLYDHHEIIEAEDHFSNQSFLWNWNF